VSAAPRPERHGNLAQHERLNERLARRHDLEQRRRIGYR
jgi:hypothetical protein